MFKTSLSLIASSLLCSIYVSAYAADNITSPKTEATRVIKASGIVRMVKATNQPAKFACVDKAWKKSEVEVQGLLATNFTGEELHTIADFYETPLGAKYITAIETQVYNRNHPAQAKTIANFSDAEQLELKQFYETPAGKKYLSSPEAQIITDATIKAGFDIALACFKPK
ncbi:DUF2059 domain-containing protein [Undibacterium sp. Ji83W]|uniref:DUF2059 domain-containing protein n=1 Tax=Undibacterium sp. Ji83W TaxID=3413043 RepID=UPI003BF328C5